MKAFFDWLSVHPSVKVIFEDEWFGEYGIINITMIGKKYKVRHVIDTGWFTDDKNIFYILEHLYEELCDLEIVVDKSVDKVGDEE